MFLSLVAVPGGYHEIRHARPDDDEVAAAYVSWTRTNNQGRPA
jgi:hypothetical protein